MICVKWKYSFDLVGVSPIAWRVKSTRVWRSMWSWSLNQGKPPRLDMTRRMWHSSRDWKLLINPQSSVSMTKCGVSGWCCTAVLRCTVESLGVSRASLHRWGHILLKQAFLAFAGCSWLECFTACRPLRYLRSLQENYGPWGPSFQQHPVEQFPRFQVVIYDYINRFNQNDFLWL